MVPILPTAVPVFASTKDTPGRDVVIPLNWGAHVTPLSTVRRIVPWPTAVAVLASKMDNPKSETVVPLLWRVHVSPPSMVRAMIPW